MDKRKRTKKDLKNTIQKAKDQAPWTPLRTRGELRCYGRVSSSCSTCGIRRVTLVTTTGDKPNMRKGPACDYDKWNIGHGHGGNYRSFEVKTSTN